MTTLQRLVLACIAVCYVSACGSLPPQSEQAKAPETGAPGASNSQPGVTPNSNSGVFPPAPRDGWEPNAACNFLQTRPGLGSRGYKQRYENEWGCSSPYKDIGYAEPLPNNIAYYVKGTQHKAQELKLVINVNDKKGATDVLRELVACGRILYKNALGRDLPKVVEQSLETGKQGQWSDESARVEIIRDRWSNGKGYEVHFIISRRP